MRALRGWCFYVAFSVTLVPIALACVLLWPFAGAAWRYQRIVRPWLGLVMGMLKFFCGVTYEVRGAENIPLTSGRPVVVLSKHSSAWETLFLPYYIDHRMGFVYKESLHWIPFLGWALKSMNMIAINRSNGAGAYVSFLKKGLRFVKNGFSRKERASPGVPARATRRAAPVLPLPPKPWSCRWRTTPGASGRETASVRQAARFM